MKKSNVLLVISCVWMGTADAENAFIDMWKPVSAYEQNLKKNLLEIEDNKAVQQVSEMGSGSLDSIDIDVLRGAHEYYQWGLTLLETALKRNFFGGSKIKNSLDRKKLKLLLGNYANIDRIVLGTIQLKLNKQIYIENKLASYMLSRKQQVAKGAVAEEVAQKIDTISDLDSLVESLRNTYINEELENDAFIQQWQQDSSFISYSEYLALMDSVSSAIAKAQKLHKESEEDNRERVAAQWRFLYDWYNALQNSAVRPVNNESVA